MEEDLTEFGYLEDNMATTTRGIELGEVNNELRGGKYFPILCASLIEHMSKGYTFSSFQTIAGCTTSTLNNWIGKHREFKLAREFGERNRQLLFQDMAIAKAPSSPDLIKFLLKNADTENFKDKSEVEVGGNTIHIDMGLNLSEINAEDGRSPFELAEGTDYQVEDVTNISKLDLVESDIANQTDDFDLPSPDRFLKPVEEEWDF